MNDIIVNIIKSLLKECIELKFTKLNYYTTFRDFIYTFRYIHDGTNADYDEEDIVYRIYIKINIDAGICATINYSVVKLNKYKIIPICKFSINNNILMPNKHEDIDFISNIIYNAINRDIDESEYNYIDPIHRY